MEVHQSVWHRCVARADRADGPSVSISLGLIGLSCNLVSGGPSRSYKRLFKHSYACTLLTHLPAALVNFRWQMTIAHLPNWRRMWKIHFIEFAMWKCLEHSSAAHCTRRRVAWYNRSTDGDDRGGPPTIAMHCWSPTIGNTTYCTAGFEIA